MEKELKAISILLVDDSEDDIIIIQRGFNKANMINTLYIVRSGKEALDFIYHKGKYAEEKPPKPGLIMLDISMPGMDGFEVLEKLKADSVHKRIPVIMLTTSSREEDILRSYEDGACSFITKPANFNDFVEVIKQFEIYWTLVSATP